MNDRQIKELEMKGSAMLESVHKVMTVLMAMAIAWMVNTVNNTAKDVAVLKVKMEQAVADRYTALDARRDTALSDRRFAEIERRVLYLEKKLDK